MQTNVFMEGIKRLQNRFGASHFDSELVKLIWAEVRDLPDQDFKTIVNTCIGEFNVDYPPKLSHFREFGNQQRKLLERAQNKQFMKNWNVRPADREMSTDGMQKAMKDPDLMKTLNPEIKSLLEAITKKRSGDGAT